MDKFFLLGARDPEMERIEEILNNLGYSYAWATVNGKPVHPRNAYEADPPVVPHGHELVLVECAIRRILLDHHRPGDPGFGVSPEEFKRGSSLGQFCRLVEVEMSHDDLVLAAMDHCYPQAFRGECPGVAPEEILARKIREISRAQQINLPEEEVRSRIEFFRQALAYASTVQIGTQSVRDLRGHFCGVGYSFDYLTLQVAAMMDGEVVVFWCRDTEDGPEKWFVSGHATAEMIVAFRDEWAPVQGLSGVFVDPVRGFALGYLK